MFCARCGSTAEVRNGVLVCSATGSDFSEHATRELSAIVASEPGEVHDLKVRYGSRWYCPADGSAIDEVNGRVMCSVCRRSLPGRLLYVLIEFNYHPM